jgi:hypothetical protein
MPHQCHCLAQLSATAELSCQPQSAAASTTLCCLVKQPLCCAAAVVSAATCTAVMQRTCSGFLPAVAILHGAVGRVHAGCAPSCIPASSGCSSHSCTQQPQLRTVSVACTPCTTVQAGRLDDACVMHTTLAHTAIVRLHVRTCLCARRGRFTCDLTLLRQGGRTAPCFWLVSALSWPQLRGLTPLLTLSWVGGTLHRAGYSCQSLPQGLSLQAVCVSAFCPP